MACDRAVSKNEGRLQGHSSACMVQGAGCTREQLTEAQALPIPRVDCYTGKGLAPGLHGRLVVSSEGKLRHLGCVSIWAQAIAPQSAITLGNRPCLDCSCCWGWAQSLSLHTTLLLHWHCACTSRCVSYCRALGSGATSTASASGLASRRRLSTCASSSMCQWTAAWPQGTRAMTPSCWQVG